ncbi:MAG: OmpA family protein [Gammaproteobacteria bacterium]|nr:OmpA family protein [Gammaproteobacteria bacterium]
MLQIEEYAGECVDREGGRTLARLIEELRERNDALRYLTRWRAARESYQAQALRRSMHAITDGLRVSIPFRTGSWTLEPHLETDLVDLSKALVDMPCLQVKLEGFADTRGSRRFNRKLSMRRVYAVWTVLARSGLPVERMRLKAHGDERAVYARGDRGGFAFDRRVVVGFSISGVPR